MILFLAACSTNELPSNSNESAEYSELITAIETDMEVLGATAFAIAVIKNGELDWSEGFGTHTKTGEPVTADTLFRVASLTKPMTAVTALQQVEQGCLNLDSAVDSYLDGFVMQQQPLMAASLTVKDTLRMTGGLVDYQVQSGEDGDGMMEDFLSTYLEYSYFLSPPGRMYNYSNPNFVVAGHLVEVCSGAYFSSYMDDNLWKPLGMNRSTFHTSDVVEDADYAIGVTTHWPEQVGEEVPVDAESYAASHLWPAMGSWSSVNDLSKFALFLMHGDTAVLGTDFYEEMTTMQVDTEEGYPAKGYGFGIEVKTGIKIGEDHYPVTMLSHTGSIYGYTSHMYLVPELDVGVIVIINRDMAVPFNSVPVALDLGSMVASYTPDSDVPTDFSDYVGRYYNDFNIGEFILSETESGLTIEIPTLDEAGIGYTETLEAVRQDNFIIYYPDGSSDNLSFIRDENGDVEYIRHRNYVGERMNDSSDNSAAPTDYEVADLQLNSWAAWEQNLSVIE